MKRSIEATSYGNLKSNAPGSTRAASSSQSRVTNFSSPKNSSTVHSASRTDNNFPVKAFGDRTTKAAATRQETKEHSADAKNGRQQDLRQEKPISSSQILTSAIGSPKAALKVKLSNEKRGSSEQNHSRSSQQSSLSNSVSTATTTIKVSETINLRDSVIAERKKVKRQGLEVSTDLTNAKYSPPNGGPATTMAKFQTPKNKDGREASLNEGSLKKNGVANRSFEFSAKLNSNNNSGKNSGIVDSQTQEKGKSPMANSQILLRNNILQRSQTLEDEQGENQPRGSLSKSGILHKLFSQGQQKNPTTSSTQRSRNETPQESVSRSKKTLPFNNYFSGAPDNHRPQAQTKGSGQQIQTKLEENMNNLQQETVTQNLKKAGSRTNDNLKQSPKQVYNDARNGTQQNELSKEPKSTNSKEQPKISGKFFKDSNHQQQVEKVERVSLQSFVTKVSKGSVFSPGVHMSIKTEAESIERPSKKSIPNIEESLYQQKTSNTLPSKTPKTTSNSESRVFVFVSNDNKQASGKMSIRSSQEIKGANLKSLKNSGIVSKTTKNDAVDAQKAGLPAKTTQVTPFIYYMTSLEKHHKNFSERDYFCQIFREHFNQTHQAMAFVKYLKNVDPSVLSSKKVNLPRRPGYEDKRTVVFDLDETLIHCNESLELPCHVKLPIVFPQGEVIEAGINIRPYAIEALKELSQHFEIIVFTASHACYANVVLDHLDPKRQYVHHRLFRDSCVQTEEGVYVKDLRVIANRNLSELVLVDNAAYSFAYQLDNGIPIAPYYDHPNDEELKHLVPYLKFLNNVEDMKAINRQTFKLHMYSTYDSIEKALENIVFAK